MPALYENVYLIDMNSYVVATQPAATKQEDGSEFAGNSTTLPPDTCTDHRLAYRDGDTSWHTVFNFSEPSHNYVKSAGKG